MSAAKPAYMAINPVLSDAAVEYSDARYAAYKARKLAQAATPLAQPEIPASKTPSSVASPLNGTFTTAVNDNNAAPRSSWAQVLSKPLNWIKSLWARKGELVSHFKAVAPNILTGAGISAAARYTAGAGLASSELAGATATFGLSAIFGSGAKGFYDTYQAYKIRNAQTPEGQRIPFLFDVRALRTHGIRGIKHAFVKEDWATWGKKTRDGIPMVGAFMLAYKAAKDFNNDYNAAYDAALEKPLTRTQYLRDNWKKYTLKAGMGLGSFAGGYIGLDTAMDHIEQANAAAAITREEITRVTSPGTIKPAAIGMPVNAAPVNAPAVRAVIPAVEEVPALKAAAAPVQLTAQTLTPETAEPVIAPISYNAKPDVAAPSRPWIGRWPNLKAEGVELAAYRPPLASEFAIGNAPPRAEEALPLHGTGHDSQAARPAPPPKPAAPAAPPTPLAPAAPTAPNVPPAPAGEIPPAFKTETPVPAPDTAAPKVPENAKPEAPAAEIPPPFKTEAPAPATPPAFGPDILTFKALESAPPAPQTAPATPAPQAETAAPAAPDAAASSATPETPDTAATTVDFSTLPLEERINVLLEGVDRSGLSKTALHELNLADKYAAQGNVPWTVGNIAHYRANGLEGMEKDYASAWEWGLVASEVAKKSGSEINIRLADKFLRELQGLWNDAPKEFVSAYSPEAHAPAPAIPPVASGPNPLPPPATPKPEITAPPAAVIPPATTTPTPPAPPAPLNPAPIPPPFVTDAPPSGGIPAPAVPAEPAPSTAPAAKPAPDLKQETPEAPQAPVVKAVPPPSEAATSGNGAQPAPTTSQAETPAAPKVPEAPAAVDITTLPAGERVTKIMDGIDRSHLSKKALSDLKVAETLAAKSKDFWSIGNVGYYFANGKEGFPKDYARAWESFLTMKDAAIKAGSQADIETANKRLRELQIMWKDTPKELSSVYGPEIQVAATAPEISVAPEPATPAPPAKPAPAVRAEAPAAPPKAPATEIAPPVSTAEAQPAVRPAAPAASVQPPPTANDAAAPPPKPVSRPDHTPSATERHAAANTIPPRPTPRPSLPDAAPTGPDTRTASTPPVNNIRDLPPPQGAVASPATPEPEEAPRKIVIDMGGYEFVVERPDGKPPTQADVEIARNTLEKSNPEAALAFSRASLPVPPTITAAPVNDDKPGFFERLLSAAPSDKRDIRAGALAPEHG